MVKKSVETSIILLNYNGLHLIKKCLPTVLNQSYKDFEIILVDNGSTDGSKEWISDNYPQSKYPQLHLRHIMPNRGFTGGNNYGVQFAKGKYIVLLSNDTIAPKNWLFELINGIKQEKDAGVVSSFVLVNDHEEELKELAFKKNIFVTMSVTGELVAVPISKEESERKVVETFVACGNTLCYRKGLFKKPFDEIYFIYAEDVYASWHAHIIGSNVKVILKSQVNHATGSSKSLTKRINKIAVFNGMKNQILNFLIFYNWWNVLRILPLFMITQVGHIIYEPRKIIPKLKVFFWIFIKFPTIIKKHNSMQKERKVSDKDLISKMSYKFFEQQFKVSLPIKIVTTIMNKLFFVYCFVFRIKTREFQKQKYPK